MKIAKSLNIERNDLSVVSNDNPQTGFSDAPELHPPLVSVIVVNYNYGAFLSKCVTSLLQQTYENLEIIVVDNASTDNSRDVIIRMLAADPRVKVIWRGDNGGQNAACIDGFKASRGNYILFVDADDFLLPACIETHIWVHLSLRVPVGVSSVDMMQALDDQLILSTRQEFSGFIRANLGKNISLLRPPMGVFPATTFPTIEADATIDDAVYFVPASSADWVWAPTSGNCFRRDAIGFFIDNPDLPALRAETDAYFVTGINCLTGSVLIDRPLAVYRIHSHNLWVRLPQLNQVVAYEMTAQGHQVKVDRSGQAGRKLALHHFMHRLDVFSQLSSLDHLLKNMEDIAWHVASNGSPYYLTRLAMDHFAILAAHIGMLRSIVWILSLSMRRI